MRWRHHLLSLLLTLLALAVGLGLGAGPVVQRSAETGDAERARLQRQVEQLRAQVEADQQRQRADDQALHRLAATILGDRLDGRTVLVMATPGAEGRDVRATADALDAAGLTVSGVLTLTEVYVDPAKAKSPLEDLALRLVPPGVTFPDSATAIRRVGTVVARAVVQRPADDAAPAVADEVDQDAAEVIFGLDELKALRLKGEAGRRAELAVVVTGAGDRAETSRDALAGLVAELDEASRGTVVAGPGEAAAGLLRWVRDGAVPGVSGASTVDSYDDTGGAAGRTALLLALAEQLAGSSGDYGTGRGAEAVVPVVAPAPAG